MTSTAQRRRNDLTIGDLAKIVTSKNAGPHLLTVDVFFEDLESYELVKNSGAVSPESIAAAYGIDVGEVQLVRFSDAARGFKVTMNQRVAADDFRSRDIYGAQQHMPVALLRLAREASVV